MTHPAFRDAGAAFFCRDNYRKVTPTRRKRPPSPTRKIMHMDFDFSPSNVVSYILQVRGRTAVFLIKSGDEASTMWVSRSVLDDGLLVYTATGHDETCPRDPPRVRDTTRVSKDHAMWDYVRSRAQIAMSEPHTRVYSEAGTCVYHRVGQRGLTKDELLSKKKSRRMKVAGNGTISAHERKRSMERRETGRLRLHCLQLTNTVYEKDLRISHLRRKVTLMRDMIAQLKKDKKEHMQQNKNKL
jgi:hypothetical protein